MKKILAIIFIVLPIRIFCQLFDGGVQVGLTGSQIDGDALGGYKKIFFSPFVYSQLNLNKISILSGVGYIMKGAREMKSPIFHDVTLHYAEIPLLFTFKMFKNDTIFNFFDKVDFTVGLLYGYLIDGNINNSGAIVNIFQTDIRKSDFYYWLSINYKLSSKLKIQFVYNYSLFTVNKEPFSLKIYSNMLNRAIYNIYTPWLWWNRTIRLNFQIKLFSTKKQK